MRLKIFNQNIAEVNSYVLQEKDEIIIIDPGFNGTELIKFMTEKSLRLKAVLLTHGHFDHIQSISDLAKLTSFMLYVHEQDEKLLRDEEKNYAKAFGLSFELPSNVGIHTLRDGDKLNLLGIMIQVIHTPGHTKGSICFKYQNWLFTGDTLFSDSIGRTDLFSASQSDMKRSLKLLIDTTGNQVEIYPGHGEHAKMSKVKEINPYM